MIENIPNGILAVIFAVLFLDWLIIVHFFAREAGKDAYPAVQAIAQDREPEDWR